MTAPGPPESHDEIDPLRSLVARLSEITTEIAGVIHRLEARRVVDADG